MWILPGSPRSSPEFSSFLFYFSSFASIFSCFVSLMWFCFLKNSMFLGFCCTSHQSGVHYQVKIFSLCWMFSAEIWMSILIMSEVEYWKIWICLNFGWWVNVVSVTLGHCGFIWCAHFPVMNIWTQQIIFLSCNQVQKLFSKLSRIL